MNSGNPSTGTPGRGVASEWRLAMKIKYFAYLRDITHTAAEHYSQPAATIGGLLETLCQRYGPDFSRWIRTPEGGISTIAIILINGKDIRDGAWVDTPLSPDDEVCIFPPVAGG